MECPQCRLVNPPTAQRCDCGHDFVAQHHSTASSGGQTRPSRLSRRAVVRLVIAVVVIGVGAWRVAQRESAADRLGEALRQEAYKSYHVTMNNAGVQTDETRQFVDRSHDECLREAVAGGGGDILPLVRPAYKSCLDRALRAGR